VEVDSLEVKGDSQVVALVLDSQGITPFGCHLIVFLVVVLVEEVQVVDFLEVVLVEEVQVVDFLEEVVGEVRVVVEEGEEEVEVVVVGVEEVVVMMAVVNHQSRLNSLDYLLVV
jgi:hypothetical protein